MKKQKIKGKVDMPRLSVFKSSKFIYAQIIDDAKGITLIGISEKHLEEKNGQKIERAKKLGLLLAKKALEKKIKKIVFDRRNYVYHGRVKAFADGARKGGLEF